VRLAVLGSDRRSLPQIHKPATVARDRFALFLIHARPFWRRNARGTCPAAAAGLPGAQKRILNRCNNLVSRNCSPAVRDTALQQAHNFERRHVRVQLPGNAE
jgi:hypothetical protein